MALNRNMPRKNLLLSAPPYPVEQALRRWGANLRTARLRRNFTIEDVAVKIGTGPRAVMDAEKGRPGTSAAVYLALLWAYDLLDPMAEIADPAKDAEGLARSGDRQRAHRAQGRFDDDF
jgi:transcriptional regulator with XRE-family HTH domain